MFIRISFLCFCAICIIGHLEKWEESLTYLMDD